MQRSCADVNSPINESGKRNIDTFYLSQVKYRVKLKFVVLLWPPGADKVSCWSWTISVIGQLIFHGVIKRRQRRQRSSLYNWSGASWRTGRGFRDGYWPNVSSRHLLWSPALYFSTLTFHHSGCHKSFFPSDDCPNFLMSFVTRLKKDRWSSC